MKTLLTGVIALITLAWASGVQVGDAGSTLGALRQEGLYLTGLLSIGLMSMALFLAARPAWLEGPMGGLDRMYRTHKWAGILAVSFAVLHWLIEMTDDLLEDLGVGAGRLHEDEDGEDGGWLENLRDLAADMGEWAIYAVLAMLALTLWRHFPYRPWRLLHRAMPLLYLMLVFHALLLAPVHYWLQPAGGLLALLLLGGVYGSALSLAGRIGHSRQVQGEVVAVERTAGDIVAVQCRLAQEWRGHRPGQFALVTFDRGEGAHPFTIASADRGDRSVTFHIKALGDYTRGLADRLTPGQPMRLEGPYGRFDIARRNPQAKQLWVAGGIGITPFLAWLESFQAKPEHAPVADLHYCTRDRADDPYVARLQALCAGLPGIALHVHGSRQGEVLSAATLTPPTARRGNAELWFCGPQGLAATLEENLRASWRGRFRMRREFFSLR